MSSRGTASIIVPQKASVLREGNVAWTSALDPPVQSG